jgi:hypothetical protein
MEVRWSASRLDRFTPRERKSPRFPLDKRLGGPQSCSGRGGESPVQWIPEVKLPGHEADHKLPSSAEVKNLLELSSTPPYFFMAWCLVKNRTSYY